MNVFVHSLIHQHFLTAEVLENSAENRQDHCRSQLTGVACVINGYGSGGDRKPQCSVMLLRSSALCHSQNTAKKQDGNPNPNVSLSCDAWQMQMSDVLFI